jgi:hypothetical protein
LSTEDWSEDDFTVIIVIAYLKTKCQEDSGQWEMLVKKAMKWLQARHGVAEIKSAVRMVSSKLKH